MNRRLAAVTVISVALAGCTRADPVTGADLGGDASRDAGVVDAATSRPDVRKFTQASIYAWAGRCVSLRIEDSGREFWLRPVDGGYRFVVGSAENASRFFMQPSDLGTYLLYDQGSAYLHADDDGVHRRDELESDVYRVDDAWISGGEWHLQPSDVVSERHQLQNRKTGLLLGPTGLVSDVEDAAAFEMVHAEGCADHPEMSIDATGTVEPRTYPDGSLFGAVDAHSHILPNFAFGGGGIMHGSPFHRLGVEHAMGTCEPFHAEEGRADFLGWGYEQASTAISQTELISVLNTGRVNRFVHATDGWPTYSDWPSQTSKTHQTQYYRWIERAWMAGLRLVVQHALNNEVFCRLMADTQFQPVRWGCEDMLNVDRQIQEVRNMEAYIDAQWGGPGKGWFRIVESPAEAREVIAAGKLAVVLGLEVPNPFSCYLNPPEGAPDCDEDWVESELDRYYEMGIRVMFPNHKYDNAFTPGDGDRGMVELGNWMQSGHWSNYVQDCPDVPSVFDKGPVQFGGINEPRDEYLSPAPNDPVELSTEPLRDLQPYLGRLTDGALEGDYCQNSGLTELGRHLLRELMKRGMIIEVDHLPRWSYADAYEMLTAADYPPIGTHRNTNNGKIYELGGISPTGFHRCADPDQPGSLMRPFFERREMIRAAGGYESVGFAFDFNGLAGVADPRFGPDARCGAEQQNPVEYPFESFAGDVIFTQPFMGERAVDFNTEGMIHIGLLPELIEDARRTGATDEDLDIIFRSAEGYVRMWELAEARGRALAGE